jgi:nitrite reductase/ring-hydroxylating ferredoxin subunit
MKSFVVARVGEIAEGERRVISCDGIEIGVFNVDGELVAWHNQCVHRGGPVCQGRIFHRVREPVDANGQTRTLQHDPKDRNIVCPWHGWEFDLRTGRHPGGDRFALRPAKVEITDGHVCVAI